MSFDQSELRPWKRDLEHVTLKMDKKRENWNSGHVIFIFRVDGVELGNIRNYFYRIFPSRDFQTLRIIQLGNIQLGKKRENRINKSERGINFDQSEKRRINHVFFRICTDHMTSRKSKFNLIGLSQGQIKHLRYIRPIRI